MFIREILLGAFGLAYVLGLSADSGNTAANAIISVALGFINMLGITAGYHRLWSHGAFEAASSLRYFLAFLGSLSWQGSIKWWVVRHRLHHRFTDTPLDPYDSSRGLWYSHFGWLFEKVAVFYCIYMHSCSFPA